MVLSTSLKHSPENKPASNDLGRAKMEEDVLLREPAHTKADERGLIKQAYVTIIISCKSG
jgi:hypothetical protein